MASKIKSGINDSIRLANVSVDVEGTRREVRPLHQEITKSLSRAALSYQPLDALPRPSDPTYNADRDDVMDKQCLPGTRVKLLREIAEWVKTHSPGDPILPLSVSFEERLASLDGGADAAAAEEECKNLGTKSALPKIITTMRKSLELGSFFTTGTDEVRQWTIR